MAGIRSLAKETAVYGLSSIIGRFLNWCLVPLYVYIFLPPEYGIVSYLYSFTAVALVILNYGMETGFFRFANKKEEDWRRVFSTTLFAVVSTSALFMLLISVFIKPISGILLLSDHPMYVWILGITVALDAIANIPFALLRFRNKAFRFAGIKLLNVGLNIFLNLFFLLWCPLIERHAPGAISWFYPQLGGEGFGIGWIFLANFISSLVVLLMLVPQMMEATSSFDGGLLRRMLRYSWPLLVLGIAGIMSQNMGQMIIPYLFPGNPEEARAMVGIYGANIKIAIVMVMFIQAFRFAYEPFIFAQNRESGDSKLQAYRDAMKYFIIFALFIFLGVMFYLDIIKYFIDKNYFSGLKVVPVLMMAELFFGIFFNLSLWYKLTDKTVWGMWFSLLGLLVTVVLNVLFVPRFGYMACAWAAFASYGTMMLTSYFIGRSKYPIGYDIKGIFSYFVIAIVLYVTASLVNIEPEWARLLFRTVLLAGYVYIVCRRESINPLAILRRNRPVKTPTNK